MTQRVKVEITTKWVPYYEQALLNTKAVTGEARARAVVREVNALARQDVLNFVGHEAQPVFAGVTNTDIDNDTIHLAVVFDNPEAAMLFKLAYGGGEA